MTRSLHRSGLAFVLLLAVASCADSDTQAVDPGRGEVDVNDAGDAAADGGPHASDAAPSDTAAADADASSDTAGFIDDAAPSLAANRYGVVGEGVTFELAAPDGAVSMTIRFGDGRTETLPATTDEIEHVYDEPGRYRPSITAEDALGRTRVAERLLTVTWPVVHQPRHASSIVMRVDDSIAVVEPDADTLTILALDADQLSVVRHVATCDRPRTVAALDSAFAVACSADDRVCVYPDAGAPACVDMPWGSRPHGIVASDRVLYVTLQGSGELAIIDVDEPTAFRRVPAVPDARGAALMPDGSVVVTRWRSEDERASFVRVDPTTGERTPGELAFVDRLASDTETGGVPSYLDAFVVSPDGRTAVLPSTLANHGQGLYLNGEELSHETTVRAVVSTVALPELSERPERRLQFDDRGLASAAAFSSRGDYLFVAHRGARAVDRIDALSGSSSGTLLDVGYAPSGLALVDDRWLLVHASLSREVRVYDVSDFSALPVPRSFASTVDVEPLSPLELRGRQLFSDSFDTRLARDGYIACAHCHLDGESDRRTWDFTDRGEGLRSTISLLGRAGDGDGPIHWSANFDEIHDFEHDIRGPFQGTGLLDDAIFYADGHDDPLGAPKAGLSDDLDALAAWVTSLSEVPRSPHRESDGSLTEAATRGRALFFDDETGCAGCHGGPRYTDSAWLEPGVPLLHDVGTLTDASGQRLGGGLPGLDTPTLLGAWNTGPWLHDGSAATMLDVFTTRNPDDLHGRTSQLTAQELEDLASFVLSLQGSDDERP